MDYLESFESKKPRDSLIFFYRLLLFSAQIPADNILIFSDNLIERTGKLNYSLDLSVLTNDLHCSQIHKR